MSAWYEPPGAREGTDVSEASLMGTRELSTELCVTERFTLSSVFVGETRLQTNVFDAA